MLGRYFRRLWILITGVAVSFAIAGAFSFAETGSIGITWDDAPFVAIAVAGMFVIAMLFALDPGWFDPPKK